ncbi:extracellular solute-binding protein [Cohnella sp. 56]|uniref:extracellular solute-binding protein n=1 Tax=Cohnella sp. 56 TaxID=3113722 RepID=UPI0030EA0F7A
MAKSKALTVSAVGLSVMLALGACSNGNSSSNATKTAAPANTSSASADASGDNGGTATASPSDSPPSDSFDMGGREIRIATWWDATPTADTPAGKASLDQLKAVEKKYNVKIKYLNVPYDQFTSKFTSTVLAGDPFADIVNYEYRWAIPAIVNGQMLKMSEYTDPEDDINTTQKILVKSLPVLGDDYAISGAPGAGGGGLFYNRDLFKKMGLPDLHEIVDQGDWTWAKFEEIAKEATRDTDNDGKTDVWGTSGWSEELAQFLISSNGGAKIADDATGKEGISDPRTVEALNFLNQLYADKVVRVKGKEINNYTERDTFTDGNVAMAYGWDWMAGAYQGKFDYGMVPFPKGPQGTDYTFPSGGGGWFMPKGVKDPIQVFKIYEELANIPPVDEYPGQTWLEQTVFKHQDDVDTMLKDINGKQTLQVYGAFDGLKFGDAITDIVSKHQSVSSVVEKYKQPFQDAIDKIYKK